MGKWLRDNLIGIVGAAITVLNYCGVTFADIADTASPVASALPKLAPLLYVVSGILIGWWLRGKRLGLTTALEQRHKRIVAEKEAEEKLTASFKTIPYGLKAFLKTAYVHEYAYRDPSTNYFVGVESDMKYLSQFVDSTTIRNGITRYALKEDARRWFDDFPDLLGDVSDTDVARHAVNGTEGVKPTVVSSRLYWWYYSDDENLPEPYGDIGFARQPPFGI